MNDYSYFQEARAWRTLAIKREEVICKQGKEIVKLKKKVTRLKNKLSLAPTWSLVDSLCLRLQDKGV